LDGVADCFDALHFTRHDKAKALDIMKGKTIGAFGACALILVIVGKLVAISAIPEGIRIESLLVIPAVSRWTPSIVAWKRAPASAQGLGFIFSVYTTRRAFLVSAVIALTFSALLLGVKGLLIFVFVSILALFLSSFFSRSFGGITGDVFGAVIEL
jgi:adenosylcobinamide-GDP ribazoletransferase